MAKRNLSRKELEELKKKEEIEAAAEVSILKSNFNISKIRLLFKNLNVNFWYLNISKTGHSRQLNARL